MLLMMSSYFLLASFLFNLRVGVNVPFSTEKSSGNMLIVWIFCALDMAFSLYLLIPSMTALKTKGSDRAWWIFLAFEPYFS